LQFSPHITYTFSLKMILVEKKMRTPRRLNFERGWEKHSLT
jgi:hypothetical protein